jgi:hypothetical protein
MLWINLYNKHFSKFIFRLSTIRSDVLSLATDLVCNGQLPIRIKSLNFYQKNDNLNSIKTMNTLIWKISFRKTELELLNWHFYQENRWRDEYVLNAKNNLICNCVTLIFWFFKLHCARWATCLRIILYRKLF